MDARTEGAGRPAGHPAGGAAGARLTATAAAQAALARIEALRGELALVLPVRQSLQELPRCVPAREFFIAPSDRRLGAVGACGCYVDADLDDARGRPAYELDLADGEPTEPVLGADPHRHFVLRVAA